MKRMNSIVVTVIGVVGCGLVASGCSNGSRRRVPVAGVPAGAVQVERLARPAVNEGLVRTNGFLLAFNGITPATDGA